MSKICSNCKKKIGLFSKSYEVDNKLVCSDCREIILNAKRKKEALEESKRVKQEQLKSSKNNHTQNMKQVTLSMNVEMIVSSGFSQFRDMFPPANEIVTRYKEVLQNNRIKAGGNDEDYLEVMYINVGFLIKSVEEKFHLFTNYLNSNNIPSSDKFNDDVIKIQEMLRKNTAYDLIETKKLYNKYNTLSEKLDQIEFDYMFYKSYDDLLLNFIGAFTDNPVANKTAITELFKYQPSVIVQCIKKHAVLSVNTILGNIKFQA